MKNQITTDDWNSKHDVIQTASIVIHTLKIIEEYWRS